MPGNFDLDIRGLEKTRSRSTGGGGKTEIPVAVRLGDGCADCPAPHQSLVCFRSEKYRVVPGEVRNRHVLGTLSLRGVLGRSTVSKQNHLVSAGQVGQSLSGFAAHSPVLYWSKCKSVEVHHREHAPEEAHPAKKKPLTWREQNAANAATKGDEDDCNAIAVALAHSKSGICLPREVLLPEVAQTLLPDLKHKGPAIATGVGIGNHCQQHVVGFHS
mmetsp:Transcript_34268/g.79852  ORF Transcript_34268/g.79852 Transcript_34268/m.79852 type:complete len:216 (-) Transcript_34268:684-1331(-)